MTKDIKPTERRWLKSVIAASAEPLPRFPWMRGARRRPEAVAPVTEPEGAQGAALSPVAARPQVQPRRVTTAAAR
jgi:hypothetical protein